MDVRSMVEAVAQALVDQPDKIRVKETRSESMIIIEVVSNGEIGKIIGKDGKTAEALRFLVNCISARKKERYFLQIVG